MGNRFFLEQGMGRPGPSCKYGIDCYLILTRYKYYFCVHATDRRCLERIAPSPPPRNPRLGSSEDDPDTLNR